MAPVLADDDAGAGGAVTAGVAHRGMPSNSCAGQACGSVCLGNDNLMDPSRPDFSGMCDMNGVCQRELTACEPPRCMAVEDCRGPIHLPCEMCPNGESACPVTDCQMGFCITRTPTCGFTQCENVECGTPCDPCADGQSCPDLGMDAASYGTCDSGGECVAGEAECGTVCMTTADCPQRELCRACADTGLCGADLCVNGRCQMVCPVPMADACQVDMDCPPPPPVCDMCPNGACADTSCIEGACVYGCGSE